MSGDAASTSDVPFDAESLLPLVYAELKRLAASQLASERANHTLSPTALVHEAYLRLLGPEGAPALWNSRGHFFSAAARAMRRILVDSARKRRAEKRGGPEAQQVSLEFAEIASAGDGPTDILELDAALEKL
jgi:RNA polymerase sigma factor (TIGR02999 family)